MERTKGSGRGEVVDVDCVIGGTRCGDWTGGSYGSYRCGVGWVGEELG